MDLLKLTLNTQSLLGSTTVNMKQLTEAQGYLLYVCGAYIVFYNPTTGEQVAYIKHRSPNINCLAVSADQHKLAVTDKGKYHIISIYDISRIQELRGNQNLPLRELKGHKYTVDLICFSPNNKYLLSVANHDGSMFLWEGNQTITRNRLSKALTKTFFDRNGHLVTLGHGYFKVWNFKEGQVIRRLQEDCWMMEGRLINFNKKFSTKQFIDGKGCKMSGEDKLLLLSNDGLLCIIKGNYECIEKWIDLMMPEASGIQIVQNIALFSGERATVKAIDLTTLTLQHKFPKPAPLNKENISQSQKLDFQQNEQFANCLGVKRVGESVITLYQNKTIFVWKLQNNIKPLRSIMTHRQRINSICLLEQISKDLIFFGTASEDHTIRIWHFYKKEYTGNKQLIDIASEIGLKRNVYCRNLTRIIYTDSEHPITRIKMYCKQSLVCISRQECLLYSLDTYQLVIHQNFKNEHHFTQLLSLETDQDYIYLGKENGTITVYKPNGSELLKVRQFIMEMPVQNLQIANSRLMAQGKGRLKCISLDNKTISNQYNIECSIMSNSFLIQCEKTTISLYSWTKAKKTATLTLSHQLDQRQQIRSVRSNSWLIVIITSINRLIVANFSSTVLYSEELTDLISDCVVTEGGEILLTTDNGTVIIKSQEDSSRYHRIDEKVKKWFERNDLSWMDGSVWASSQIKSQLQSMHKQKLSSIQQAQSIRLSPQEIQLAKPQLPRRVLEYKNNDNKQSIFDPTLICAQANKIYMDVNQLMKNKKGNVEGGPVRKHEIQLSGSLEQLQLSSMPNSKNIKPQKRESTYSKFTNNLVQSVLSPLNDVKSLRNSRGIDDNNQHIVISPQEQVDFEISNQVSSSPYASNTGLPPQPASGVQQSREFIHSVNNLFASYDIIKDSKQKIQSIVSEHHDDYMRLFQLLVIGLGKEEEQKQKRKRLAQKYRNFTLSFLQQLQK